MKICVVGLGYIGLPTAAMLASRGHEVVGFDVSERVVAAINAGQAHFQEPDLQMLLSAAVETGQLRASSEPEAADYFVIAVPTPIKPGGAPDMSYVESAAERIAQFDDLARALAARVPAFRDEGAGHDVAVSHCPERILPGQMVRELVSNDRIIGGMTSHCAQKALALYKSFVMGTCYLTDARVAELVKLTENAFRDVNIAFANELSVICDRFGVSVWEVRELANQHPRVSILQPGAGVGGHCIAVDPWFIVHSAPEEARLIRTAREVNDAKPHKIVGEIAALADRFKNPTIACYGITYKPDVDDIRESPAMAIVAAVAGIEGARVLVCEPNLAELPAALKTHGNVSLADTDAAHETADIAAFLVGHRAFASLDRDAFHSKAVVDPIGLFATPGKPA